MTIPLSNHHFMHQNMRQNGSISHFHATRFQHLQQGRLEGSRSHDRVESVIWTPSRVATDPRCNYYCMVQCPEGKNHGFSYLNLGFYFQIFLNFSALTHQFY